MAHTRSTDVLIVGAGPVGLSAAAGLAPHGVRIRLVDRLPARLPYAKAVGIQPRTLEIWDRMGLARDVVEAAVPLHGQLTYVNGIEQPRMELELPPEVPYGVAALPQYETERLLEEYLAGLGTAIERETELLSFSQDADGVTALLDSASGGQEEVRAGFLLGCDGAHSAVRKGLGLSFEGGAFPTSYMLADVEADWDLPAGYSVRAGHRAADGPADAPQPGDRAPDCEGLAAPLVTYRMRLLDVLRGCPGHVVIRYLTDPADPVAARAAAELEGARAIGTAAPTPHRARGPRTVAVVARGTEPRESPGTPAGLSAVVELPVPGYLDTAGEFARTYRPEGPTGFIVRPDGQLGARFPLSRTKEALAEYLAALSVPA
ncbi:FAD-dependent monooxygenase [Streptomyces sp. NBC_00212]|uniref:FAD-dependent monooxygenase n=1 Tax=Streptomyces sp. NBC_00212 TaxID=2975684 RepID=UPI003254858A